MKNPLIALLCCFLLSTWSAGAADPSLGKVVSFSGSVLVDSFGKGTFLAAIRGDLLYRTSVLRTAADGRATIELQGKSQEIAPGATVKIADLLVASAKKGGLAWFGALGNLVRSFSEASQKKDDQLTLGSRAADVSQGQGGDEIDWEVEETDAARLLPEAQKEIELRNYSAALAELGKADAPSDPAVAWDLSFWKGFCFYQLEDYGDAVKSHTDAYKRMKASRTAIGSPQNRRMLLFQLASSQYLLGQDMLSIPLFDEYLAEKSGDAYEPYASLFLARALAAAGDAKRARTVAEEALRKYRGTALEGEFASLLK
jgi:tetratricopeptide (TPR) repeat protein